MESDSLFESGNIRYPMGMKSGIQERLEMVRRSTKLSQAAFGERLGLSDRAYKNYELGIRDLPLRVALDISEKFEVDVGWLLTGDGARDTPTTGEAVEAAVIAVREHFLATSKEVAPEKEGAIVRYIFEEILRRDGLNSERIGAYLRTI